MSMTRLGILLSGRGSNFVAIADNISNGKLMAEIAIVISNREDAGGIAAAKARGLKTVVLPSKGRKREEHDSRRSRRPARGRSGTGGAGRISAAALTVVCAAVSRKNFEHSSFTAARFSRTGGAEASARIRSAGQRLHRALCGRAPGSWSDCAAKGGASAALRR